MSHLRLTTNRRCVFGCDLLAVRCVPLHRFPNPDKKMVFFTAWVSAVGDRIKEADPIKIYRNKRVCDHHFLQSQKVRAGRLVHNAVPSINLCAIKQSAINILELEHNYCFPRRSNEDISVAPLRTSEIIPMPSGSSAATCTFVPDELQPHASAFTNIAVTRLKQKRKENRLLKAKLRRLQNKTNLLKEQAMNSEKRDLDKILHSMSETAKIFTKLQYREANKKVKGRRYTMDEKVL